MLFNSLIRCLAKGVESIKETIIHNVEETTRVQGATLLFELNW